MRKIIILFIAMRCFAVTPPEFVGNLTPEQFKNAQQRINQDIYRRLGRVQVQANETSISTGTIATAKAKKLYLKDIRAEQVYPGALQTDDDGQGQVDDLYYGKLARLANTDAIYRTVVGTLIYFSSGTAYTITLDGTDGGSEFLGSMVMTSTDTYWTTGGTRTIRVNGNMVTEYSGDITSSLYESFDQYPSMTNWSITINEACGDSASVSGGKLEMYGRVPSPFDSVGEIKFERAKTYQSSTTIVNITASVSKTSDIPNNRQIGFGFNAQTYGIPRIGFYQNTTESSVYLYWREVDGAYANELLSFTFNDDDTLTLVLEHTGTALNWKAVKNKVEYSGSKLTYTSDDLTPFLGMWTSHFSSGADPIEKLCLWGYYKEEIYTTYSQKTYELTTIEPKGGTTSKTRGLNIKIGNGEIFHSAEGGVGIYDESVKRDDTFDIGAEGGKITFYSTSTVGLSFIIRETTAPISIEYDGSEITFGTTTRTAGDTYADDIYGDNAVIKDTVTASGIVLDNVNLTSNNFGLRISSNVYVNGKSSATFHYGSGKYLTDVNADLLDGHHESYFAVRSSWVLTAISTGANYAAINSTAAALSAEIARAIARENNIAYSTGTTYAALQSTFTYLNEYKLDESSAALTYMNVSERDNYMTYPATFTIGGGGGDVYLASTQTFTGQNTFSNTVFVSSSIEFPTSKSKIEIDATNDLNIWAGTTDSPKILKLRGDQINLYGGGIVFLTADAAIVGNNSAITSIDWANSDDGAGSLLDADKLDGLDSLDFIKKDGSVAMTGTFNTGSNWISGDGGAEGVKVDAAGNVGIGMTPTFSTDIFGTGGTTFRINSANNTMLRIDTNRADGRNYAFQLNVSAAGDFGLYKSTVAGGNPMTDYTKPILYSSSVGDVGIGTNNPNGHRLRILEGAAWSEIDAGEAQFATSSSRKLKKDIEYLPTDIAKFKQLKPVKFKWKTKDELIASGVNVSTSMAEPSTTEVFGMIAEDVNAVYPDMETGVIEWNKIQAEHIKTTVYLLNKIEQLEIRLAILEAK